MYQSPSQADPEYSPHMAIVVSPLRALMFDQVDICTKMGIKAIALTEYKDMSQEAIESEWKRWIYITVIKFDYHICLFPKNVNPWETWRVELMSSKNYKYVCVSKYLFCHLMIIPGVKNSHQSVVFASPEALELGPWLQILKKHQNKVSVLAFDEVHCVSEW